MIVLPCESESDEYFKGIKLWYHGTTSAYMNVFDRTLASKSKKNRDFGTGFYLAGNKDQAIAWAERKANTFNDANYDSFSVMPMVLTCKVQIYGTTNDYKFKNFGSTFSQELLDYLVFNRLDRGSSSVFDVFDVVFGLVADGTKLDETLALYKSGKLSFEEAKSKIEFEKFQAQLCIKNQDLLDSDYFKINSKELIKINGGKRLHER